MVKSVDLLSRYMQRAYLASPIIVTRVPDMYDGHATCVHHTIWQVTMTGLHMMQAGLYPVQQSLGQQLLLDRHDRRHLLAYLARIAASVEQRGDVRVVDSSKPSAELQKQVACPLLSKAAAHL